MEKEIKRGGTHLHVSRTTDEIYTDIVVRVHSNVWNTGTGTPRWALMLVSCGW